MSKKRTCAHCAENVPEVGSQLCAVCETLPRCEVCDVFFDGMFKASANNPRRDDACLNYEELVKFKCFIPGCDRVLPVYISKTSMVLRYIQRGNCCSKHNWEAHKASQKATEGEGKQFVGYLEIMKDLYDGGKITESQWRRAVRANLHDVKWFGDLDINKDEEQDLIEQFADIIIPNDEEVN